MSGLRPIIENAVAAYIAEHPKQFSERGIEKAPTGLTRKIMSALVPRDGGAAADPEPPAPVAELARLAVDPTSAEGRAYINLRAVAGANAPFKMGDGKISLPPEAQKPAVYAFADMPTPAEFITAQRQIGAWMQFFDEALPKGVARKSIQIERKGETGILMPWPWPPSVTGKIYTAGEAAVE